MPRIINLSSLHTLLPISSGIEAFTYLCDKYSRGGCFSHCPSTFTKLTNKAWVMYIYQKNLNTLIIPYKMGKIDTQQFLEKMLQIFDFLENDEPTFFRGSDRLRIESIKDNLISTRGVQHLTNHHIALALIEQAWNANIRFISSDSAKTDYLLKQNIETPSYLISNTNELNVNKILCLLKRSYPQIKWQEVDLSVNDTNEDGLLEIAPNLFLCLSYKVHAFKTTSENREIQATTPSLLRYLVGRLGGDTFNIEVISQYDKDLEEAEKLGIPKGNLKAAKDYFPEPDLYGNIHCKLY